MLYNPPHEYLRPEFGAMQLDVRHYLDADLYRARGLEYMFLLSKRFATLVAFSLRQKIISLFDDEFNI